MFEAIGKLFGRLLLLLYNWTSNYGVAVILFALVVKLIMLPFQLKSKKSMMRTSRMTPRLKELEKKFGNDQQRYQQELNKLYKEEGVNPMSGCIWSLIPFPILIALYRAIRFPLTTTMGVASELLAEGGAIYQKLLELGFSTEALTSRQQVYAQIFQSKFITEHFSDFAALSDKLQPLSYKFLGLDLGSTPNIAFWNWDAFNWANIGLFLIPIVSAGLSYLSMVISNASNPQTKDQQQQMKTMSITMPLISLWICFTMPGVMGIYWIAQSLFSIIQDVILNKVFNKQLDIEDADRIEREKARAAELEAKREETERLRAEGLSVENKNTSKKNKRAAAAQKEAERKAAEQRAEKAKKRAALGIVDEIPASQVGNRRYARGRAYVPDRYTNPEEAEEKTLAAAEESETYEAESVEEPVADEVLEDTAGVEAEDFENDMSADAEATDAEADEDEDEDEAEDAQTDSEEAAEELGDEPAAEEDADEAEDDPAEDSEE
ncbi:MAG: membrane protein insertase YidC [Oscillospiraceae bacterium]